MEVMRAFVRLRDMLSAHKELVRKLVDKDCATLYLITSLGGISHGKRARLS
jgi:hypothetical protein